MAVVIDTSNLIISNIAVMWKNRKDTNYLDMLRNTYTAEELKQGGKVVKDTLRSMMIASLGKYIKKFAKGHGKIYVCMDDRQKKYWRKEPVLGGFIEYKGNRKPQSGDDPVPYAKLIPMAHQILDELAEVFPYMFVLVKYAEGDDIIAVLTKHYQLQNEEVIVVSEDKDMVQLQARGGVKQYRPIADKDHNFTMEEAKAQIIEMLLTGDTGDGVPNVRSPINIFVDLTPEGKQKNRSPSISAKLKQLAISLDSPAEAIKQMLNADEHEFVLSRLAQNEKWILLYDKTPEKLVDEILSYVPQKPLGANAKVQAYLSTHKQCATHLRNADNFMVDENINPFAARKSEAKQSTAVLDDDFFLEL